MKCPEFDTLMMFLDGELPEEELEAVSKHVMSCSNCRKIIDSQRKLETSWRDSFVIPENEQFRRLEQSIYNRINRHSRWRALVPAAAGIIAVLLGVKLIINNRPAPDRITELYRGIREEEYVIDDRSIIGDQMERISGIDSEHLDDLNESAPVAIPSDVQTTVEEVTEETISWHDAEGTFLEQEVQMGSAQEEEIIAGSMSIADSPDQESDGQSPTSDTEIATGAAAGGSGGFYGYTITEESEEYEAPAEAVTGIAAAEDSGCEIQMDETCDILFSLDTDTAGLETVQTVSINSDEIEDNRSSIQAGEIHSRLNGFTADYSESSAEEVFVELAFDADGIPDSFTVLLLDSLCAGWSDYIPFYYRDTVLTVPISDLQSLFMDESAVTVESMEE